MRYNDDTDHSLLLTLGSIKEECHLVSRFIQGKGGYKLIWEIKVRGFISGERCVYLLVSDGLALDRFLMDEFEVKVYKKHEPTFNTLILVGFGVHVM